jgi:hypothetical protein
MSELSDSDRTKLLEATRIHKSRAGAGEPPPAAIAAVAKSIDNLPEPAPRKFPPRIEDPKPVAMPLRPLPASAASAEIEKISPAFRATLSTAISECKTPIYIFGDVGTGKTCGAACVYRAWRGTAVWYETGRIISDVLHCRSSDSGTVLRTPEAPDNACYGGSFEESEASILRKMRDASLVVFNDVGIRRPSEAALEIFLQMLDLRIGKMTIATSNLAPEDLAALFDERVASRLFRGQTIHVVGDDRRAKDADFVRVKAGAP